MTNSLIDVEALVREARAAEEERINKKIESVRMLAKSAERATDLKTQLADAEGDWAAQYKAAIDAGFAEKELTKLKPPAGARPKAAPKKSRPVQTAPVEPPASE